MIKAMQLIIIVIIIIHCEKSWKPEEFLKCVKTKGKHKCIHIFIDTILFNIILIFTFENA